jgi:hypothetical protein
MDFNFWRHSQEASLRYVEGIKGTDLKDITDPVIECQKRQLESKGWFKTAEGWYHQNVNCSKSVRFTLQGDKEIAQPALTFNQAFEHLTMEMLNNEDKEVAPSEIPVLIEKPLQEIRQEVRQETRVPITR